MVDTRSTASADLERQAVRIAQSEDVYRPAVGEAAQDRIGEVRGSEGARYRLRPLGGGREWEAEPEHLRPISQAELLSARVAAANSQRERCGRGACDR